MADLPTTIGWIGLGSMGFPMAGNLVKKMREDAQFYVYDVVQDFVDRFVAEGKGRVHACQSAKEVADKSVRTPSQHTSIPSSQKFRHVAGLMVLLVRHPH
jgi:6-phosphogluconate dehydrogenase (decarboxylating)